MWIVQHGTVSGQKCCYSSLFYPWNVRDIYLKCLNGGSENIFILFCFIRLFTGYWGEGTLIELMSSVKSKTRVEEVLRSFPSVNVVIPQYRNTVTCTNSSFRMAYFRMTYVISSELNHWWLMSLKCCSWCLSGSLWLFYKLVSAHSIKSYLIFLLNIFCKLTVMAQKIGTLNLSDIKDSLFPVSWGLLRGKCADMALRTSLVRKPW